MCTYPRPHGRPTPLDRRLTRVSTCSLPSNADVVEDGRHKRAYIYILTLSIGAVALSATASVPASADHGSVTRVSLAANRTFSEPEGLKLIVSRALTLTAGEARHVKGRLQAASSTTQIVAMNIMVRCLDSAGVQVG
jgi:hypothetical protein